MPRDTLRGSRPSHRCRHNFSAPPHASARTDSDVSHSSSPAARRASSSGEVRSARSSRDHIERPAARRMSLSNVALAAGGPDAEPPLDLLSPNSLYPTSSFCRFRIRGIKKNISQSVASLGAPASARSLTAPAIREETVSLPPRYVQTSAPPPPPLTLLAAGG